jgi:hypothetical protein
VTLNNWIVKTTGLSDEQSHGLKGSLYGARLYKVLKGALDGQSLPNNVITS